MLRITLFNLGKHRLTQANIGEYIMATLAEIRAKLQEQEVKRSPNSSGGDNAIYPFWNIPEEIGRAHV